VGRSAAGCAVELAAPAAVGGPTDCAFARLLLLTDPYSVPDDAGSAWICYADRLWRPGKPYPGKWAGSWAAALTEYQR
jgi:hypothetical protein